MSEVALCTCGKLLIHQFYFRELTWLCLSCGNLFGRPPRKQDGTPETEAKWRALEAEFLTHCARHLLVIGMLKEDCKRCSPPIEEDHIVHATRQEWLACNDAIKWLSERTGREFRLVNGDMVPQ